ncbi:MAG: glycosyltransferase 87 family protein [Candidatus Anammoxibacter sp.]
MLSKNSLVPLIITGLVIEALCVAIAFIGDINKNIPAFSFLYSASFIIYIFAMFFVLKKNVLRRNTKQCVITQETNTDKTTGIGSGRIIWTILIFSFIFRLTLLPVTPSDDIYRYLWEGKLQLNWINPYTFAPESPVLEHLRDRFFAGINHKHLPTIYPPLTLVGFAIASLVSHTEISMKVFFLLFDLGLIFLLIRFLKREGKDPVNVVIYAWSPLVLISFAARGHCDSLQIFFVVLALYLYSQQKKLTSVIMVGLAVISKIISIIIVPFFVLRNKPWFIVPLFLVIFFFYIPYISSGAGLFSTFFHFGAQYHFNDSLHFIIFCLTLGSPLISNLITPVIFGIVLLVLYLKYAGCRSLFGFKLNCSVNRNSDENDSILKYTFFAIGAFLMLTPTVHPWYLTWIVPFLCFHQSRAWLVLTGTVVFYYFMNHALFSTLIEHNNEWVWKEVHWLKLLEYLPFYSLLIYDFVMDRKKNRKMNVRQLSDHQ